VTLAGLMSAGDSKLKRLYAQGQPTPIPDGESFGRATLKSGTALGRTSETFFSWFWTGKVFDKATSTLVNKLLIGRTVKARVYTGASWFDGKPAIIIDYQGTSWIAGPVRDEIRLVAPSLYLGYAYLRSAGKPQLLAFALDFAKTR